MTGRRSMCRRIAARSCDQRGMTMIELIVAASIGVIISAMILVSWFALSRSYASTVKRDKVGDSARLTLARVAREIRDAEEPPATVSECVVVRARPYYMELYTTFNKPGSQFADVKPRLVMYRLYQVTQPDGSVVGQLWRFQDADGNGSISGIADAAESSFNVAERTDGEGAQFMATNVVNETTPSSSSPTPVFTYIYYNDDGTLAYAHDIRGTSSRLQIRATEVNLLLDMNPGKSPAYTHLRTTAQLRNTR